MPKQFIQKLVMVRPNTGVEYHFDVKSVQYIWKTYGRNSGQPTLLSETHENQGTTFIITRTWESYEAYQNFKKDPVILASIGESEAYNAENGILTQDVSDLNQND
jgi:hypothetical protein